MKFNLYIKVFSGKGVFLFGFLLIGKLWLWGGPPEHRDILPALISDNMVFQREAPIRVWGWSKPGKEIRVHLGADFKATVASEDGSWNVVFEPRAASLAPITLRIQGIEDHLIENIEIGDVWLLSGQSNMDWPLSKSDVWDQMIPEEVVQGLRLFKVPRSVANHVERIGEGNWHIADPRELADFSAIGALMGLELQDRKGVPIGLVQSSWGGTRASAWTPTKAMQESSKLKVILEEWEVEMKRFPQLKAEFEQNYDTLLAEWQISVEKATIQGIAPPPRPKLRTGPDTQYVPAALFNAMISPLTPFQFQGVVWYQGESDVGKPVIYDDLLQAMVTAWRTAFKNPELPFFIFQLPNLWRQPEPTTSGWPELREAQLNAARSLNHAWIISTIDIGDSGDIHPVKKQDFAWRILQVIEQTIYGNEELGALTPVLETQQFIGRQGILEFSPKVTELIVQTRTSVLIAGNDRVFHPACIRVEGNLIHAESPRVADPVAIRYAWGDNPVTGLSSRSKMAVSPFRTDNWEQSTVSYCQEALKLISGKGLEQLEKGCSCSH